MGTLTDDDLRHLLGEAGASFEVPDEGPNEVLELAAVVPLHRRRLVQLPAAAALVALALLAGTALFIGDDVDRVGQLAGAPNAVGDTVDTDGAGRAVADEQAAPVAAGEAPAPQVAAPQAATSGADALLSLDAGAAGSTSGGAVARSVGQAPAAAAPAPAAPVAADGARIVKTGVIALIVDDGRVSPVLSEVQALATAVGGVVASAKTQESGPTPSGSVTLRVPVGRFEEVVAKVRALKADVRSATTSGADVTAQYADLEAQLRTLTAARERFLQILARANSIGDVLAVQQRIDGVTGQIDRLEGQRRVLADQSDRATLEVSVTERDDPVVVQEAPDTGLSKAFSDAWQGFTSGVEGLIRLSGRGVLLLMCLAVATVVLRLGWRASRRRLV